MGYGVTGRIESRPVQPARGRGTSRRAALGTTLVETTRWAQSGGLDTLYAKGIRFQYGLVEVRCRYVIGTWKAS